MTIAIGSLALLHVAICMAGCRSRVIPQEQRPVMLAIGALYLIAAAIAFK